MNVKQVTVKKFAADMKLVNGKGEENIPAATCILNWLTQIGVAKKVGTEPRPLVDGKPAVGKKANIFEIPEKVEISL